MVIHGGFPTSRGLLQCHPYLMHIRTASWPLELGTASLVYPKPQPLNLILVGPVIQETTHKRTQRQDECWSTGPRGQGVHYLGAMLMPERKKLFSTGDYAFHYINIANGITKIKILKEAPETCPEWMQSVIRACEAPENLEGQGT